MLAMLSSLLLLAAFADVSQVLAITSYANDFVNPRLLLNSWTWNTHDPLVLGNIVGQADDLTRQGPWSMAQMLLFPTNVG